MTETALENRLYKPDYGYGLHGVKKPDYSLCCVEVCRPQGGWTYFGQCAKKRGYGPDGAYCKTHDPATVAARQEKANASYKAKSNAERYSWHGRAFYNALKQIAEGHNDARGYAAEVIAKFHEGEN